MTFFLNILNIFIDLGFLIGIVLIASFWGNFLLRIAKLYSLNFFEKFVFSEGIGLGFLAYLTFLLGIFGLLSPTIFYLFFLISLILALPKLKQLAFKIKLSKLNPYEVLLIAIILFSIILNFTSTLLPPISRDSLKYHLYVPKVYVEEGRLVFIPYNIFANFPQTIEMLYTVSLLLRRENLPQLMHWFLGILTSLAIYIFSRRYLSRKNALLSLTIFYTTPIVSQISGWAYVDLGLSFYVTLALLSLIRWFDSSSNKELILSSIFAGLAMGIKYLGISSFLLLNFGIFYQAFYLRKKPILALFKGVLIFCLIALAIASPWYIKNIINTGNPLYPFFYHIFGGPYWDNQRAIWYSHFLGLYGRGHGWRDYLLLPWRLTVFGGEGMRNFDGAIGPTYLLVFALIIFIKRLDKNFAYITIYSVLSFILWARMSQQARFLIPCLAGFALVSGFILGFLNQNYLRVYRLVSSILLLLFLTNLTHPFKNVVQNNPFPLLIDKISKDEYLSSRLKNYSLIKYINHNLPQEAKLLFVHIPNIDYYCERKFISDSVFEEYTFKKILETSTTPEEIKEKLSKLEITHLLIDEWITKELVHPFLKEEQNQIYSLFKSKYLKPILQKDRVCLYKFISI